jgi:sulfur carrier protein
MDANQIATAVNGEFVPRALRAQTWLAAGDTVLTFQAIVGG